MIARYKQTHTMDRKPGSGPPFAARNEDNVKKARDLMDENPKNAAGNVVRETGSLPRDIPEEGP